MLVEMVVAIAALAGAMDETSQVRSTFVLPDWALTTPADAAAIGGVDPVSYFDEGEPLPGDENIFSTWRGARFYFNSQRHKEMFEADPEHFAPAFGGLDPESLRAGEFEAADPAYWTIVEDRLYISRSPQSADAFQSHADETIAQASTVWRMVDDSVERPRFFNAHTPSYGPCRFAGDKGPVLGCHRGGVLKARF